MKTNVNLEALVGVMAFLGSTFVMGLAIIIILHSIRARKRGRARTVGLAALKGTGTPLTTPLRPGESYTTNMVFDFPVDITGPQLLIREGVNITHFIIGHENSFWHKKTKFRPES